jgi:hypothetical protein
LSLPQALTWIATNGELAEGAEFDLSVCERAWQALASLLASGKVSGVGNKVNYRVKYARGGFSSPGVTLVETGLRFHPPESPGFPLGARLRKRTDQNGKITLDVYDPSERRIAIALGGEPWWSDISFLRSDIVSAFPPRPKPGKRGPKLKYQPEKIRAFIFKQMDYHGDFDPGDVEWRGEANLVYALVTEFGMAESTAKASLKEHLAAWRRERADN